MDSSQKSGRGELATLSRVERLGVGLSLACAVHCAAVPLAVALLPLVGHGIAVPHWVEALIIGTAAAIGLVTLGLSVRRHGQATPLVLFVAGLAAVILGHSTLHGALGEIAAVLGALMLAGGQFLNWRLSACACQAHSH